MQTFIPHANMPLSAYVLDSKRLNKQLLEGRQIYQILAEGRTTGGWVNHPAVKMWRNYDNWLYLYLRNIKDECVARGIKTEKNWDAIERMHEMNYNRGETAIMPPWYTDERVHQSHRFNLYKKDPEYYAHYYDVENVTCCERCNYFWPTHTLTYNAEV